MALPAGNQPHRLVALSGERRGEHEKGRRARVQVRRDAEALCQRPHQFRGREIGTVAHEIGTARRGGRFDAGQYCIDEVAHINEAASIAHRGKRKRPPARHQLHQAQEVSLHAGPVDQGRAQDNDLESCFALDRPQRLLGFPLRRAVGILRPRRVVLGIGAGKGSLAVDLDAAQEHQTAHPGGGRLRGEPPRPVNVDAPAGGKRVGGGFAKHVRSRDEVHHRFDTAERPGPVGRPVDVADRCRFSITRMLLREPSNSAPRRAAGSIQGWNERRTDEAARARYKDAVLAGHLRITGLCARPSGSRNPCSSG